MNRKRRLENAARLADDYSLTHKDSFVGKPHQSFSLSGRQDPSSSNLPPPGSTGNSGKEDSRKDKFVNGSRSRFKFKVQASHKF